MLKRLFIACLIGFAAISSAPALAQTAGLTDDPDTINIYFFWGNGCPHCAKEEVYLTNLEETNPKIDVYRFEVWKNADNRELMKQIGEAFSLDLTGVPATFVGNQYLTGYQSDATTGDAISKAVDKCLSEACPDPIGAGLGFVQPTEEPPAEEPPAPEEPAAEPSAEPVGVQIEGSEGAETSPGLSIEESGIAAVAVGDINIPFYGAFNPMSVSLPVLTVIIGLLDGFNPCAMWTLMFLISLLLGMGNRRRMWLLGGAFILASGAVYFLFMTAWLNLMMFIGFIAWVRFAIGAVALVSGVYSVREFFTNKDATCKVTHGGERQKTFDKLKDIVKRQSFLLALGGIILLACAVNLVELICSIGLPAIYTQVLTLSTIPTWQYYLYLLLYIFFFMLDDMIVFVVSMTTLHLTGLTTKYSRWSRLIGGVLIFLLGVLLIFKPAWLMFG